MEREEYSLSQLNSSDREDLKSIIEQGQQYQAEEDKNGFNVYHLRTKQSPKCKTIHLNDDDDQSSIDTHSAPKPKITEIVSVQVINHVLLVKVIDDKHNVMLMPVSQVRRINPTKLLSFFIQSYLKSIKADTQTISIDE